MTMRPPALPYVGHEELADSPHVMVDGAVRPGSVLTLSHWPQSPTPPLLARDLSAEIVLELQRGARRLGATETPHRSGEAPDDVITKAVAAVKGAVAATSDHFDEDGLVALFALVDPEAALDDGELLVAVASCGDFGVVRSAVSARICFAIGPLAAEEAGVAGGGCQPAATQELYSAMLPRLPELLAHPEQFEPYWTEEWRALTAGRAALEHGIVTMEEYPDVDLAVIRRLSAPPKGVGGTGGDASGDGRLEEAAGALPIHPAAAHSATSANRILALDGDKCELYFRYESWVRLVSRPVRLRPDLRPLALELSEAEPSGGHWEENGVGAIVARLRPAGGRSEIDPTLIVAMVRRYLASAPPAWDPFRQQGGYIPLGEQGRYLSPQAGSHDWVWGRRRSRGRRRA